MRTIPPGEDRLRLTCPDCGFIAYENPKIVVGSVVDIAGDVLLCRRAIEPRRGFWTLPAGYLELGESAEEGAMREAFEEAEARIAINALLAVYSIPRISQIQLIFRATLAEPGFAAGPESLEVRRFAIADVPRDEIAFPSVHWALEEFVRRRGQSGFAPGSNPPDTDDRPPGL